MPEILPRHYIIGIIVFTMIIVGGVSMITDFAAGDPTLIDTDKFNSFNRTFNKRAELEAQVGTLKDRIEDPDEEKQGGIIGAFGFLDNLVRTSWGAVKTIISSFSFMNDVFNGLETVLGIPGWVGALIITMVTIIFVFAIFTIIFQREI